MNEYKKDDNKNTNKQKNNINNKINFNANKNKIKKEEKTTDNKNKMKNKLGDKKIKEEKNEDNNDLYINSKPLERKMDFSEFKQKLTNRQNRPPSSNKVKNKPIIPQEKIQKNNKKVSGKSENIVDFKSFKAAKLAKK